MGKVRLLLVEDDPSFAFITRGSLELTGHYEVRSASDGQEGLKAYEEFSPDVIVSDIEMPVMDGMEMVRRIRRRDERVPILFATGRTSTEDILKGYELRVDNFIKKPFLPAELDAHIQAILKRIQPISKVYESQGVISIGSYLLNPDTRILQWEKEVFKLTERECKILIKLNNNRGELIRRDVLLEELWGMNDFYTSRSLDVFINSLRKYLNCDPSIRILTIRGEGLKFVIAG